MCLTTSLQYSWKCNNDLLRANISWLNYTTDWGHFLEWEPSLIKIILGITHISASKHRYLWPLHNKTTIMFCQVQQIGAHFADDLDEGIEKEFVNVQQRSTCIVEMQHNSVLLRISSKLCIWWWSCYSLKLVTLDYLLHGVVDIYIRVWFIVLCSRLKKMMRKFADSTNSVSYL